MKEKIIEILKSKSNEGIAWTQEGKVKYYNLDQEFFEEVAEEIQKHFKENEAFEMYDRGYKFGKEKKNASFEEVKNNLVDDTEDFKEYAVNDFWYNSDKYKSKGSPDNKFYKNNL